MRARHLLSGKLPHLLSGKRCGGRTAGELLAAEHILGDATLRRAEEVAKERMVTVEDILREEGLVTNKLLQEAVAEHYRLPQKGQLSLFGTRAAFGALRAKLLTRRFLNASRRAERAEANRMRKERARLRAIRNARISLERKQRRRAEKAAAKEERLRKRNEERQNAVEKREQARARKEAQTRERTRKAQEKRHEREAARQRKAREREEKRREMAEEKERKRAQRRAAREAAKNKRAEERQRRRDEKRLARESAKRANEEAKAARREAARRAEEEKRRRRSEIREPKRKPEERGEMRAPLPITVQGIVTTQQVPAAAAPIVIAPPVVVRQVLPPTKEEQSAVDAMREELAALKEENRSLRDHLANTGRQQTVIVEKETASAGAVADEERRQIEAERRALAEERTRFEREKRELIAQAQVAETRAAKREPEAASSATPAGAPPPRSVATDVAALEAQRRELGEERMRLLAERETFEREKKSAAQPPAREGGTLSADDRTAILRDLRKEYEEKLQTQRGKFSAEREELIREAAKARTGVSGGAELTRVRGEAKEEAEAALRRERTQWEIEKERIRQEAIAEAESGFLARMKESGGLFGGKQKSALTSEIAKWKEQAEKLERERRELEQQKVLHGEEVRMREEERQLEQEKLRVERERISKEKASLASEETHKEILEEERGKMEKEKLELEEAKKAGEKQAKEARKSAKKARKDKRGLFGEKKKEPVPADAPAKSAIDIGKILLSQNYIEAQELDDAKRKAEERNVSLENILREEGLVTKELAQNAIAEYYNMPFLDIGAQPPDTEAVEMLPEEIAMYLHAIAVGTSEDGTLTVATSNPEEADMIREEIRKALPGAANIMLVYTSKEAIESALAFYRKALNTRFSRIIAEHKKIAPEIIEEIFADAVQLGASDIHFEPQEKIVIVRFRVDGVMHEAGRIPKEYYEGIVNRVKIAGNMRIDEHFAAQDGAIRWKSGDRAMDVRVSIVPIVDGEKVVMRLLSEYVRTLTLRDLGFAARHLGLLVKAAHKPFGMILTTGPTGSGKSTTLYGLMKIRNSPDVNISTIEDPVEYKIPGINHIQVNPKANLTFERGLRALVRQDPDIILVGEIRDDITAQISVNAALTGHLLFSTLHANDAATAIPRLLEMGIEPYLLGSTLELIIAQRLMRRICMNCRYSHNVSLAEARQLFSNAEAYFTEGEGVMLYRGKGCGACGETGYRGRVGVYELLHVTQEIEEAVVARRTSGEINAIARSQGMLTLFEDGLEKVTSGLSTIDELLRIAAPPDVLKEATL